MEARALLKAGTTFMATLYVGKISPGAFGSICERTWLPAAGKFDHASRHC